MIIFLFLNKIFSNNSVIVYLNESRNVMMEVMLRNYNEKVVSSYVMYKKNDILLNKYNILSISQKFFYEKDGKIMGEVYISSAKNYNSIFNLISFAIPNKDFMIGTEYYIYSFTESDKTFCIGPLIFLENGTFTFDKVYFVSDEFKIELLPAKDVFKYEDEEYNEDLKKITFKEVLICIGVTIIFLIFIFSMFFLYKRMFFSEGKI